MILNNFNTIGEVIDCDTPKFKEYVESSNIGELSQLRVAMLTEFNRAIQVQNDLTDTMKSLDKSSSEFEELKRVSKDLYSKMFSMEEKNKIILDRIEVLSHLSGDK